MRLPHRQAPRQFTLNLRAIPSCTLEKAGSLAQDKLLRLQSRRASEAFCYLVTNFLAFETSLVARPRVVDSPELVS